MYTDVDEKNPLNQVVILFENQIDLKQNNINGELIKI